LYKIKKSIYNAKVQLDNFAGSFHYILLRTVHYNKQQMASD